MNSNEATLRVGDGFDMTVNQAGNEALIRLVAQNAGNRMYYPGQFMDFYERHAPMGFRERNGDLLENADTEYPSLWAELKKPVNAWKLKTPAEWDAMHGVAGNVGGVPFFVLDDEAKTIRLPDTRGDMFKASGRGYEGYDGSVGSWHADAVRPLNDSVRTIISTTNGSFNVGLSGAIGVGWIGDAGWANLDITSNVPTAPENRTRAFAMLGCVYVGNGYESVIMYGCLQASSTAVHTDGYKWCPVYNSGGFTIRDEFYLIVPRTGLYIVSHCGLESNKITDLYTYVVRNSKTVGFARIPSTNRYSSLSCLVYCEKGDPIHIASHTASTSVKVITDTSDSHFSAVLLAPMPD